MKQDNRQAADARRHTPPLRRIRIALASVCFMLIAWLFLDFTGTAQPLVGWLAKIQFLPAVMALNLWVIIGLVVLTLIFGRIYCSVICPLGIVQDIFGWAGKKARKNRYTFSRAKSVLRYSVLVLFIAAIIGGIGSLVQLLAPYSAFGRIATNLLQPVYQAGNNVLASVAEYYDSYAFYHSDIWLRSIASLVIAALTLIVLAVLAWRNGRTWCNTICPVGTTLSLLSRFSFLKIRFDEEKCRNCSLCTKNCKAACIDYKTHTVDASRCVVCGDCLKSCRHGALSYSFSGNNKNAGAAAQPGEQSSSRRTFLASSAMLATAALAQEKKKVDGGLAEIADKAVPHRNTPLSPPGSLSARNMQQRCTGCQLCISECPNQVLRPSTDLLHLMQPVMSYERGYCRPECNRCSEVCPAGAIQPIRKEDKASTQIGHAVWIKKNCVVLTDGVECGNCARHCPVQAIEMVPSDPEDDESPYVPAVNEARCIGCGACEYLCPSRPFSAIYVEGHEVHKEN